MRPRRRRTDHLPPAGQLPLDPVERGRAACEALALSGFDSVLALQVQDGASDPLLVGSSGRVEPVERVARAAACEGAARQRPLHMPDAVSDTRVVAIPAGHLHGSQMLVVVADPLLSRRECEALAAWLAPPVPLRPVGGGACAQLARDLAIEFDADVVVFSLFASAGMLLNMHVRSGGLLRAWRVPVDTVWGEAARHAAAFMLGELHLHPGAEVLASLGMNSAAVVGLDNGRGVAIGAVGLGSRQDLDLDVARTLLDRSHELGPRVMKLRSRSAVPVPDEGGAVELTGFARRVGCKRFALYAREGNVLRLMAAHAGDGSRLMSPPDPYEEQLVCWAAEKGIAVVSEDAAAVLVGETVLYAQDPVKRPMDQLRLALQDLRESPYGAPSPGLDADELADVPDPGMELPDVPYPEDDDDLGEQAA